MKILDRYILKTFLVSLLIVSAALMGLTLLLDLFFNINKIMDLISAETKNLGFWTVFSSILNYYFYKAFSYFQVLAAPIMLVSAAASVVRLGRGRELTGIKAAGISLYRVIWPMIVASLLLDAFYIVNQEVIIPSIAVELARDADELQLRDVFPVDFVRDARNNVLYAPIYDPKAKELRSEPHFGPDGKSMASAKVRILLRDANYVPTGYIEADKGAWFEKGTMKGWRLEKGLQFVPGQEDVLRERIPSEPEGRPLEFYATNVGPEEIARQRQSDFYRYMSYDDLKILAKDPMRSNWRQLQVALHQHTTMPIMNLLVLLLGLPFVAGHEDRNYFIGIGVAISLFIGVFCLMFATTAFGNSGHLSPLLAAWIPIFVTLPASIVSLEAMKT